MKTKIKKRIMLLKREFRATYIALATGDTTCFSRADRATFIAVLAAAMIFPLTGQSFAAGGLIEEASNIAGDIYGDIAVNITKFAGLAAGVCIVWFFLCTNDDDARRPIKWLKRIFVAYIMFMILGAVFAFIENKATSNNMNLQL